MNAGLCDTCRHQYLVRTTRGSTFSRCERSKADPVYPKYPRLPVTTCAGHEPRANVELVQAIYDRFRGGDPDGALARYDPEVEVPHTLVQQPGAADLGSAMRGPSVTAG